MPGIVLGKDLAEKLGVTVGDAVEVLTPEGTLTPMGMMPAARAFKVVGIFAWASSSSTHLRIRDLDVAKRMLDRGAGFHRGAVDDLFAAREVAPIDHPASDPIIRRRTGPT